MMSITHTLRNALQGVAAVVADLLTYGRGVLSVQNRQHLTGAQAVVATLRAHNVDTVFGIPGVHTLPIYDAFGAEPALRHILARHEQGAGFMAEGYARASGRVGVVCTITGPGVTNVATPVADAYADSIPLLVISSSLSHAALGQGRGELHEVKNQVGVMESLTGWTHVVQRVEEIPEVLNAALCALQTGRPRGAYLQIPLDLLEASADVDILSPVLADPLSPDAAAIQTAAQLLRTAQRPLIIAGAGVTGAGANAQLATLAEILQAPVILGNKSHDVLPSKHPLVITTGYDLPAEVCTLTANSDVTLVIGSKLGAERTDHARLPLSRQLIHIDVDADEIGHNYPASLAIVADARLTLEALLTALQGQSLHSSSRLAEIAQARAAVLRDSRFANGETFSLLEGVYAGLPAESIVVADMTLLGYASALYLPSSAPRTFIHPAEFCAIGCGLPLALGAKIAAPERPVIALCGDGGFLLNASELATAAQEQIPIIAVIFNDSTYATVKKEQQQRFAGRYIATDLLAPDYVALARAFHVEGLRAESPQQVRDALQTALQHAGPTVIDVTLPCREW